MLIDAIEPVSVTLLDGAKINYVRAGSGPVLIFIHGVMGDYRSWGSQWEAYTRHYDCISISCRFNYPNNNEMEAPNHSAIENADDVAELMDILNIEHAIIVGSSYGAFTALALAVHHLKNVRAVVAVEPAMMKYAEIFEDTREAAEIFWQKTATPAREAFERGDNETGVMMLTGGIQNKDVSTIPSEKLLQRRQNMMAGRRVTLSTDEFPLLEPEALGAIDIPVLLMTGKNTAPVFKAIMSGVVRTMPQARFEVIEGSGHSVPQDQPKVFNQLSLKFLAERL